MLDIFNADELLEKAKNNQQKYMSAQPFPHITFDNFMDSKLLDKALEEFPTPEQIDFYKYDNPFEKKLAFDQINKLPKTIAQILLAMNTPAFLRFLEELTGIEGLVPDPYYRGGGIHQIVKGGKLDVHIDFNKYTKLGLYRRLNVLLYLNKDWKEEYGGYFELWKGTRVGEEHILEACKGKVLPIFNRLVVFSTSETSYHGHPEPLTCPDGWTRKSIATYYYTAQQEEVAAHSTTFIRRPDEEVDAELEKLRKERSKSRLKSNVKSDFTA